jgi:hypothetical protein
MQAETLSATNISFPYNSNDMHENSITYSYKLGGDPAS